MSRDYEKADVDAVKDEEMRDRFEDLFEDPLVIPHPSRACSQGCLNNCYSGDCRKKCCD